MPRARVKCPNFLPYHAALGSLTDVMEKNRRKKNVVFMNRPHNFRKIDSVVQINYPTNSSESYVICKLSRSVLPRFQSILETSTAPQAHGFRFRFVV